MIDAARWPLDALARAWRGAEPFAHVVIDDLVAPADFAALRGGLAQEPHYPSGDELHRFLASGAQVARPELRAFGEALGAPAQLAAVSALTGKAVSRAEVRSYVYLEGHYLLPHTDHRRDLGRAVAFAYYLSGDEEVEGGELLLFDCKTEEGEITATAPSVRIAPRSNRLVLFDVSKVSLHQVCEVTRGARLSLAGWLYP